MTALPRYPITTPPPPHHPLCNVRAYNVVICTCCSRPCRTHLPVHPGSRPRTAMLPCSPTMYSKHMRPPCSAKFRPQTQRTPPIPSLQAAEVIAWSMRQYARAGGGCPRSWSDSPRPRLPTASFASSARRTARVPSPPRFFDAPS